MVAESEGLSVILARSSLGLAAAALIVFAFGLFVPVDFSPFQFGQELIISPVLALLAVAAALSAWLRSTLRRKLHRIALKTAVCILLLTGAYTGLFVLAYSNCPNGVC